jgi:hypothetical protein
MSDHPELSAQLGLDSHPPIIGIPETDIPFNMETWLEDTITWIISSDESLSVVDSPEFRDMIRSLNPSIPDHAIPHRTTIHDRILKRYKRDREELRKKLKDSLGRVSVTTDLWSNKSMRSFMAVTLHWIARTKGGELELMTALGAFRYVNNQHSGRNIAQHLVKALEELDILDRIGGITLDNASNNDTAMAVIEDYFEECGLKYDALQQRVRCVSHVIHLAVRSFLDILPHPGGLRLQDIDDADVKAAFRQSKRDPAYIAAIKTDLIGRTADVITQLRSSGQRRDAFTQAIRDSHHDKRIDPPLSLLQHLRQVVTRWSSTFLMVDRFLYLSPATNILLAGDNPASLTRDDSLSVRETIILDDIREILSFFHSAQETLACEKTPTLPFVLPLYEDLLGALKDLCSPYPNLIHAIWASIQKLEKYLAACRDTHLYTLAMGMSPPLTLIAIADLLLSVLHPGVKLEWVRKIWSEARIEDAKRITLDAVSRVLFQGLSTDALLDGYV